jgi:hypothetical protein
MSACWHGHIEVVKYFISLGCDKDEQDYQSQFVFLLACYNGHLEVVKYLLSLGCDVNRKNKNGMTAFMAAAREVFDGTLRTNNNIELQVFLLEYGIEITKTISKEKHSDLYTAIQHRQQEIQNVFNNIEFNFRPSFNI